MSLMRHTGLALPSIVMSAAILESELPDLEEFDMHIAHRYISSLLLTAVLATPLAIMAAPAPQSVQLRIYDRDHKDYHNWDDREDHAYRAYLTEQHQTYRVYAKQNRKNQGLYWNWRHSHPDHD
jgi:hypothetical protein